jgi:hypothetical protein
VFPLSTYLNDQPFNLRLVDASGNQKHTSIYPDLYDYAFELVTDAFVKEPGSRLASRTETNLTNDEMSQKVELLPLTEIGRTCLVIQSPLLRKALISVVKHYPDHSWISNPSAAASIVQPYGVLFHHYHEIEDFVSPESNKTASAESNDSTTYIDGEVTLREMALLLVFLRPMYESIVKPAAHSLARKVPVIGFDMLWYLFRPGMDVWVQGTADVYMAVVHMIEYNWHHEQRKGDPSGPSGSILYLWRLSTDGNRVARTTIQHEIEYYAGQIEVTSLAVCPVSYWDTTDQGARRQRTLAKSQLLVEAMRKGSLYIDYDEPNNTDVS